jgi:hypothetical protein
MQRSFTRVLVLLGVALLMIGSTTFAANKRLSLQEAKAFVNKELFHNELKEVSLHEITTDEVWKRMGVQVYQEGFLIDNKTIVAIFNPASYTSLAMYTSDLDKNGSPELICSFTVGYRPLRYFISAYSNGKVLKLGKTLTDYVFHNAFTVEKQNDQKIKLAITVLENGNLKEISRFLYIRKEGDELLLDAK